MARIDSFLRLVVEQRASDLHFHAGKQPVLRRHGEILFVPFRSLSAAEARRFIVEILTPEQRRRLEDQKELDFVYDLPDVARFRVNVTHQHKGLGAVFRQIGRTIPTLEELLLPSTLKRVCSLTSGLILVTGPTGSGKSTTLAAMVGEINRTRRRHILTVEDPVEFVHIPDRSLVTQREVGSHVASFAGALKSALREAPDVIVVGEMRDAETIELALQAAETGILVFGTLHTNSAAKSIARMLDALPPESREEMRSVISTVLRAVVSQTLVRRITGDGRVAALEILLWTDAVAHLIREDKIHQLEAYLRSQPPKSGMCALDTALLRFLKASMITVDEALRVAYDPAYLSAQFDHARIDEREAAARTVAQG
jgi:twitching motility protein PilT